MGDSKKAEEQFHKDPVRCAPVSSKFDTMYV